jgi:hypothetical protein
MFAPFQSAQANFAPPNGNANEVSNNYSQMTNKEKF